jgi:hypothetical protein
MVSLTQPTGQNCTISNGNAVISGADVTDVTVTCRKWNSAGLVENDDTGDAQYPQIAFDSDGNALAVWHQWDGSYISIYANRYVAGSGWVGAELIENGAGDAQYPQIAIDGDGNALAVWQQDSGGVHSIWANRYVAGSGWDDTAAELIESGTGDAAYPQIAFDADGNAIAVWYQWGSTADDVWANRYVAGIGWDSTAAEIIDSGTGSAWHPQIAFDSDGNAIAVWQQYTGGRYSIYANRYTAVGDAWGASAELIESDDAGAATYPQIAIDSDGNALAVWDQSDGTHDNICANRYE